MNKSVEGGLKSIRNIMTVRKHPPENREQFQKFPLNLKGPLQYLFRPLLGKNEFAVTQHMYAFIGPNLYGSVYGSVYDVIEPRPMSRDQKQKNAFLLQDLLFCP